MKCKRSKSSQNLIVKEILTEADLMFNYGLNEKSREIIAKTLTWASRTATSKVVDDSTSDNQALPKKPKINIWKVLPSSKKSSSFYVFVSHYNEGNFPLILKGFYHFHYFPYHFNCTLVFNDIEIMNIHKYSSWNI